MSDSLSFRAPRVLDRDRGHALFGQTMGYVAVTTGLFALGAYLGRNLSGGWAIVSYIVAFVCNDPAYRTAHGQRLTDFQC